MADAPPDTSAPSDPEVPAVDSHVPHDPAGDPGLGMVRDSVSTFLAQLVSIVVAIVSSVLLGRSLLPTGKGLFSILILIPKSAWTFGTLGLDQVNTVYAGRDPERRHELATTTLFLGMAISVFACAVVAIFLYWPGHGAARVDIAPGDFLVAIDGHPVTAEGFDALSYTPHGQSVPVTIWRQGTLLERTIPAEAVDAPSPIAQEFRLSALNTWRYGLTVNPRFSVQQWVPILDAGLVPLTRDHWAELLRRREAKLLPDKVVLPDPQPAFLVGDVGSGGRIQKLTRRAMQEDAGLRRGDIVIQLNGLPLPADLDLAGLLTAAPNPLPVTIFRGGATLQLSLVLKEPGPIAPQPLALSQPGLREMGLLKNIEWRDQVYFPSTGIALAMLTPARVTDLVARGELPGVFAEGTVIPSRPSAIVTQVDYPWLRRWSQDLPRNLFMLTMLFFPLTASAYLMDSILYGLNLIKLRNQKAVVTNVILAVLYFITLVWYGIYVRHLSPKSAEGLMELITIAVWTTLIHGAFIAVYSWWLIAPRCKFGLKYLNFPYVFECFRHIGWQSYIANSASYLFYDVDIFIITSIIAHGATTLTLDNLGNYTQATNIVERVWIVPGAIATALLPKLTNFGVEKAGELTPKGIRHTLILTIAVIVPLCFLLPYLIPILWGPAFLPTLGPFYLLAPGILLFSLSKVYSAHLLGIAKPMYAMWYSILAVIVNIFLNYALIPQETIILGVPIGGINGAAIASTIAYSMHSMLMMTAYCREAKTTPAQIFRYTRDDWALYGRGFAMGKDMIIRALSRKSRSGQH